MPRPTTLYVPHILSAADIAPEERYQQISQNLSCYGVEVVNNRRPAEIIAHHKTISAISGDYCSAMGSKNETIFDPHQVAESSIYISLLVQGHQLIGGRKNQPSPGLIPDSSSFISAMIITIINVMMSNSCISFRIARKSTRYLAVN
jgi:hypothetical protein